MLGARRTLDEPHPAACPVLSLGKRQKDGSDGSWGHRRGHHGMVGAVGLSMSQTPLDESIVLCGMRDGGSRPGVVSSSGHQPRYPVTLILYNP